MSILLTIYETHRRKGLHSAMALFARKAFL
jgi:hypothetical protein